MSYLKEKTGITLIVLVITIIILLILAGVSISLVVGNNGILMQASTAVVTNRKSTAKEEVEMAWASCESEYWTKWASNTALQRSDIFTKDRLNYYLSETGKIINNFVYQDGENTLTYQSKDNNLQYTFLISSFGVAEEVVGGTPNIIVTFDANGGNFSGSATTTKEIIEGNAIGTLPTEPTRNGYTFKGWYNAKVNGEIITSSTCPTENTTIYCQWSPIVTTLAKNDYPSNNEELIEFCQQCGLQSNSIQEFDNFFQVHKDCFLSVEYAEMAAAIKKLVEDTGIVTFSESCFFEKSPI